MIRHVLHAESGAVRMPEMAHTAGFSRFHLSRVFKSVVGECPSDFERRIRLERAAYLLTNTDWPISEIALECGYSSGEPFLRSFRNAFGVAPSDYRRNPTGWALPCDSGLHWEPYFAGDPVASSLKQYPVSLVVRERRDLALYSIEGSYSQVSAMWEELSTYCPAEVLQGHETYVTIYYDNIWTHPDRSSMRADIGWVLEPGEKTPAGMHKLTIPGGLYVVTSNYIPRRERHDAWSFMFANWTPKQGPNELSMDEYPSWPLPFERVQTRICKGLARAGGIKNSL